MRSNKKMFSEVSEVFLSPFTSFEASLTFGWQYIQKTKRFQNLWLPWFERTYNFCIKLDRFLLLSKNHFGLRTIMVKLSDSIFNVEIIIYD